jgi:hypothetical protein
MTEQPVPAGAGKRPPRRQTFAERWRRMSLPNKLMFFATVVIAFGTIVNVAVLVLQLIGGSRQTDKLITHSDRIATAMEGSLSQAKTSLEATIQDNQKSRDANIAQNKASLEATIAQARIEQRAWVDVTPTTYPVPGIPQPGQPFMVRTRFLNTGKTPALRTRLCTSTNIIGRGKTPTFNCPIAGTGILPPGGITHTDSVITESLSPENRSELLTGQMVVWVYGIIVYDDVFGRTHWTKFCNRLLAEGLTAGEYAVCDEHNEMDKN